MPGFYASIIKNKTGEKEEKKFPEYFLTYIESYNTNSISETNSHKKMYLRNDSILITVDEASATHLTVLDLGDKKASYKKLNFSIEQGNNSSRKQGNSLFYENILYRVTASPEQLNLTAINIDSMDLTNSLNTYSYEESIPFSNTLLLQDGSIDGLGGEERVIKKTEVFFNRFLEGNIGLSTSKENDAIILKIGSHSVCFNSSFPIPIFPNAKRFHFFRYGNGWARGILFTYVSWGRIDDRRSGIFSCSKREISLFQN